ncbi:hypothetical protein D3C87_1887460 [compost metagenome]
MFWVSVPVLSEQITDAQPSVSTEGSFRTIAFRLIIRWTPKAKAIVTMAGSPSGIAATARLTPARNIETAGWPCRMPASTTTTVSASDK